MKLKATAEELKLTVDLSVYCKIVDQNAERSDLTYSKNVPLPEAVKEKADEFFINNLNALIEKEKQTKCDFLFLKRKLYQYNYPFYAQYKDNFLSVLKTEINVSVTGQK